MTRRLLLALAIAAPALLPAQGTLKAALSGRATTEIAISPPREAGKPAPKALVVKIDYGQPHARGREVPAEFQTVDTIWRTGANSSTTMTTDLDLIIGGANVPKGAYSLYSVKTATG